MPASWSERTLFRWSKTEFVPKARETYPLSNNVIKY